MEYELNTQTNLKPTTDMVVAAASSRYARLQAKLAVGPYGYCVDISRTWLCGDRKPTDTQRQLYSVAYVQLQSYLSHLQPGISFREYSELCGDLPSKYIDYRYPVLCHGVGFADEGPVIPFKEDLSNLCDDDVFQKNMTVCVESYIGEVNGREGVKLEEQVLLTETGIERLSTVEYEESWL